MTLQKRERHLPISILSLSYYFHSHFYTLLTSGQINAQLYTRRMILSKPRVKVALTLPLHRFIAEEAGRAGMSKSEFIRHLVMKHFQEKQLTQQPTHTDTFNPERVPSESFNEHI